MRWDYIHGTSTLEKSVVCCLWGRVGINIWATRLYLDIAQLSANFLFGEIPTHLLYWHVMIHCYGKYLRPSMQVVITATPLAFSAIDYTMILIYVCASGLPCHKMRLAKYLSLMSDWLDRYNSQMMIIEQQICHDVKLSLRICQIVAILANTRNLNTYFGVFAIDQPCDSPYSSIQTKSWSQCVEMRRWTTRTIVGLHLQNWSH